ncbi:ATP-binding protein [Hydrogenovibrio kuenenii]|uniref:ATP-binding protein n=1 Tax=Hydrogenovibrio kuenenii TaxID=63658 RepID=UPI000464DDA9|nr:ATP-binding protein [Hydrogenovibrio kuenenii]
MQFINPHSVNYWLSILKRMSTSGQFDGEKAPDFLRPFHLVTLALAIKKHGIDVIDLPGQIQSYATRMHLWEAAGLEPPYQVNENDRRFSLIPVRSIEDVKDIDEVSKAFEVIAAHHYEDGCSNDFGTVISELLDNCYRHAERSEDLFGLACVQTWEGGNKGQLCIADTGIGIRCALGQNEDLLERLNYDNACQMATEFGVSGKLGKGHSGYGLALAKGVIDLNCGKLLVISGDEGFESCAGVSRTFGLKSRWDGTVVILEWNLDQPLDSLPVYESWPSEEDDEYDDMF